MALAGGPGASTAFMIGEDRIGKESMIFADDGRDP